MTHSCTHKWRGKNQIVPGIAPAAFMIPKILPECFGAKSCGLARTEQLWKPAKKRQIVIKNNAKVNEYFPMRPKCRKKGKTFCYILF